MNPANTREAREYARLDLRFEDVAEEEPFNHILWRAFKGSAVPYPARAGSRSSRARAPGDSSLTSPADAAAAPAINHA